MWSINLFEFIMIILKRNIWQIKWETIVFSVFHVDYFFGPLFLHLEWTRRSFHIYIIILLIYKFVSISVCFRSKILISWKNFRVRTDFIIIWIVKIIVLRCIYYIFNRLTIYIFKLGVEFVSGNLILIMIALGNVIILLNVVKF